MKKHVDLRTDPSQEGGDDDKRQPWPNANKKSGPSSYLLGQNCLNIRLEFDF